ncbi:MAG TPA: hypothetical protein DEQ03_02655 [Marinilabiliales bacterium]|nr:hypothetical protein [Marinilabiliales bacterium]
MIEEEILAELKKINQKLDILTHPFKYARQNFLGGVFRSLGSLFGTVVIAAILIYLFSQLNLGEVLNNYIKNLIPKPQENFTSPF